MTTRRLQRRAQRQARAREIAHKAVGGEGAQEGQRFIELLIQALRDLDAQYRRSVIALVALAALFVLLTSAHIAKVSLLGFEIQELSFVHKFLPCIIAFLLYQVWYLLDAAAQYETVFDAACEVVVPRLHLERLHWLMVAPPGGIFGGGTELPLDQREARRTPRARVLVAQTIALLPLAFIAVAYVLLFERYGLDDAVVWISLGISGAAVALVLLAVREIAVVSPRWPSRR